MRSFTIASGAASSPGIAVQVFGDESPVNGSVVIGGAIGVPQRYYQGFAEWLAGQGWRVMSFDYVGQGGSWPRGQSLRHCRADLMEWARNYDAVVAAAHQAVSDKPLLLIGHSLGAQLPGLLSHPERIAGLISVAAGSGYRGENAPQLRRMLPLFWDVAVPASTGLLGYFPGRHLRMVGDLPKGVVLQWKRWCSHPDYLLGIEGDAVRARYAAVRFPIYALSVDDDELMTLKGTHSLMGFYAHAPRRIERIAPAQAGVAWLGHFGFFKDRFRHNLWPILAQALATWPHSVLQGQSDTPVQPALVHATPHVHLPHTPV